MRIYSLIMLFSIAIAIPGIAQEETAIIAEGTSPGEPLTAISESANQMRPIIDRFTADFWDMNRNYEIPISPARFERMAAFLSEWKAGLAALDFEALSHEAQVDYVLFDYALNHQIRQLELEQERYMETAEILPFAEELIALEEDRKRFDWVDSRKAAGTLNQIASQIEELHARLQEQYGQDPAAISQLLANRAADYIDELLAAVETWHTFYNGYDPLFTWWVEQPHARFQQAITAYQQWLRNKPGGAENRDDRAIVGDPVGSQRLLADLRMAMIPYSPEELIAIGWQEYNWCMAEMLKASRELGYGDDWLAALEHVKTLHVDPGEQTELIRELAYEAIEYLRTNDMMTIPPLAAESWKMNMMTPERQLITPFFTGGPTISVSYPTNTMSHEDKLMSLRGNNPYFSRAVVHHELIPGHHLQFFMNARHNTHRRIFYTPFWTEGWALWWELHLYANGFAESPEERIGMLFWRMHRCARIIFSLSYHMGEMTAEECVDFLVNKVGHERINAEAEVRRSFTTYYGPLYQAAYMVGGLQFRALYQELVTEGEWNQRDFHDFIIRTGSIPVEMVRALITGQELERDHQPLWRFYGDVEPEKESQDANK